MSTTYHHEYVQYTFPLLQLLLDVGIRPYTDGPEPADALDDLWVPLRPACRVWRVPQATQRYVEQHLREGPEAWRLPWDGQHQVLVVPLPWCQAHVLHYGRQPHCIAWAGWHAQVISALMRTGYYDPATNPTTGQQFVTRLHRCPDCGGTNWGPRGTIFVASGFPEKGAIASGSDP